MALSFSPVNQVNPRQAPQLTQAAIAEAKLAQEEAQRQAAMRSQNTAMGLGIGMEALKSDSPLNKFLPDALRNIGSDSPATGSMTTDAFQAGASGSPFTQPDAVPSFTMPEPAAAPTAGMDFSLDAAGAAPAAGLDTATAGLNFDPSQFEAAAAGADAAGTAAGAAESGMNIPVVSALRGASQLAEGDIGGAASTGGKAWLSTLGPWGIGAAIGLGLLGL